MIRINRKSRIFSSSTKEPVIRAVKNLRRDLEMCCLESADEGDSIRLLEGSQEEECFSLYVAGRELVIEAGSERGFVYGIYAVSSRILGVAPFWFWNDQQLIRQKFYTVEDGFRYESTPFAVKYRGWFVNDEVLIHTWHVDRSKDKPWEMVFEALLRLGGNMVIPGTDSNSKRYKGLAAAMGLAITHHHAEPLGAEMFARAYPGVNPSYDENRELFEKIWREGIREQKGMEVIWNLGFRGQGDYPFWENDPRYETPQMRGELMGRLIRIQYDMVKEEVPDAVCCTNLYGETMELYQEGYLKLPEDVITIWADNGFGKMVTRRQWNHNPRIYALPVRPEGRHGIYYHVSFYDLQAASHITMLPNSPEFIKQELEEVLQKDAKDYWIINCSNVKPHVYYLDFIAHMWKDGEINIEKQMEQYISQYYKTKETDRIKRCFRDYWKCAARFGEHEDEHGGDQFSNHVARVLVSQYMKNESERSEYMLWATDAPDLRGQIRWYQEICQEAAHRYRECLRRYELTALEIENEKAEELFRDSLLLQAQIHYDCYNGAAETCRALLLAMEGKYQEAFYHAGKARKSYLSGNTAMREREHGKWKNFYENDCFTDIKQSAWVLESLMSYLRNLGDGPHFYLWQREFLYSEEDKRVMLLLNLENHLKDKELFELMEEKWEE